MLRALFVVAVCCSCCATCPAAEAPPTWTLQGNSVTVFQSAQPRDGANARDLLTTYHNLKSGRALGPLWSWQAEVEGGLTADEDGGAGFEDFMQSQWSTNELHEGDALFVAVCFLAGRSPDGTLEWQLGKISPKNAMDQNRAARAKISKFIAEPFVKTPAVSFGRKGLGASARWTPDRRWQLAVCASDANAKSTQAGFSTLRGEWYRAAELTVRFFSGRAALRTLAWGTERRGVHDNGWGVSADWELAPDWVAFARLGDGSKHFATTHDFQSAGLAWEAPFGRRRDHSGVAVARGSRVATNAPSEWRAEFVYRLQLSAHLAVSPDVQYLASAGRGSTPGAWTFGVRCAFSFQL